MSESVPRCSIISVMTQWGATLAIQLRERGWLTSLGPNRPHFLCVWTLRVARRRTVVSGYAQQLRVQRRRRTYPPAPPTHPRHARPPTHPPARPPPDAPSPRPTTDAQPNPAPDPARHGTPFTTLTQATCLHQPTSNPVHEDVDDFHFAMQAAYTAETPCTNHRRPVPGSLDAAAAAAAAAAPCTRAPATPPNERQRVLVRELYKAYAPPLDERLRMTHPWLPQKEDTPETLAFFGQRGRWETRVQ